MTVKVRRIICISLTLFSFSMIAVLYPGLPEEIPMNWDLNGNYELNPKWNIWILAGLLPLFNGLMELFPHMDPKRRNYARFQKEYNVLCVILNLFLTAFLIALIVQAKAPESFSMANFTFGALGVMFILLGNMMPKFKANFSTGIRTPWALMDEENWQKTHRLGGRLFVAAGFIWLLGAFLPLSGSLMLSLGLGSVFIAGLVPYAMSYCWWRQKEG